MKLGRRRPWTRGTGWRRDATRATSVGRAALGAALLAGCVGAESQRLSCDDVYEAGEVGFDDVLTIVNTEGKGCGGGPCHRAGAQQNGLRLDTPKLIYEEMSNRPDVFYAYLASGEMPLDEERWSEEDLKVFRSWYCGGAFPP